ncbi:MBL fold metallo-hydrolase [Candidatus Marinamargulisbacteria bacterium SCGC AG-439-L15]|nr:MBL fold metallo-hydrolase [Candidatus Marinamargulisbacteria bacterium SCGC AG-439-L15]
MKMEVILWGTRGTCPLPDNPSKYGGQTTCMSIQSSDSDILIIDAGTGIRQLGKKLKNSGSDIHILLTHVHWDHIHGFPFFEPLYEKDRAIHIYSPNGKKSTHYLTEQLDGIRFPVHIKQLPSKIEEMPNLNLLGERFPYTITPIESNHSGICYGYKIKNEDKSLVFLSDNQLHEGPFQKHTFDDFIQFCSGADLLIHDAQYTQEDLPKKQQYGHSIIDEVYTLAEKAKVKKLILCHHDPDREDEEIDAMVKNSPIPCEAGYDGMKFTL